LRRIYLDNAATTPIAPEVLDAMLPYMRENFGNASSIHSYGKPAKVLVEDTRDLIADFIGSKPKEIVFTSGGTEANNFAIKGLAMNFLNSDEKNIITTKIEHLAVLDTVNYLKNKFGFKISYLDNDEYGKINLNQLEELVNDNTFLVSVMHSNNETGVINDLNAISQIAKKKNVYVHSDTIQSFGKIRFKVNELGIDTATISSHKIYGPKGIGALYMRDKTPVEKFLHGGSQERNLRGGTENIPAIAGFKKAVELVIKNFDEDTERLKGLNEYLRSKLTQKFGDKIIFNSPEDKSLPNILNISINLKQSKVDPEMLLILLDLEGIAVSGGSACTSGSHKPSHVLLNLGRDEKTALASIRISLGRYNTKEDLDYFILALKEVI
jgi:cysteine desulfurase